MNSGCSLANHESVSRGCGRAYQKGKVRSTAFSPRKNIDANCLSVDWVECTYADPDQRCVDGTIQRQANRLTIRPQKLSILNVREIKEITVQGASLDVVYFPTGPEGNRNSCHCRITGMTGGPADSDFQQELADLANRSLFVELPTAP